MEKPDLRLIKIERVVLNLSANKNIFANTYESQIYGVKEVVSKKENSTLIPINIKIKRSEEKNYLKNTGKNPNNISERIYLKSRVLLNRRNANTWTLIIS